MQQRITVEQLHELTDKQKKKLWEWWEPKKFDVVFWLTIKDEAVIVSDASWEEEWLLSISTGGFTCDLVVKEDLLPILNTGQMIKLLTVNGNKQRFCNMFYDAESLTLPWGVLNYSARKEYIAQELVKALWEAVKEVL